MKVSAGQAERFAKAPDPSIHAVLVYGPDEGLVRERAASIAGSVVSDLADPFRVTELLPGQIVDDPALLSDEMAAMAMTGGRRVVRVRQAGDTLTKNLTPVIEQAGEALLVVEAGDLPPRSSLRKAFEAAGGAAALPCYRDDGGNLARVVKTTLEADGLRASNEASAYLIAHLGGDRMVTRRELEKLVLYMGPRSDAQDPRAVELDDVLACVGDSAERTLDDLSMALGDGDLNGLDRILERALSEGVSAIGVLRAAAGHVQRLHSVAGMTASGQVAQDAMKHLRPPVFWRHAERFRRQAEGWSTAGLSRAMALLVEAEIACKSGGAPSEVQARRALLHVTALAPVRQGATRR